MWATTGVDSRKSARLAMKYFGIQNHYLLFLYSIYASLSGPSSGFIFNRHSLKKSCQSASYICEDFLKYSMCRKMVFLLLLSVCHISHPTPMQSTKNKSGCTHLWAIHSGEWTPVNEIAPSALQKTRWALADVSSAKSVVTLQHIPGFLFQKCIYTLFTCSWFRLQNTFNRLITMEFFLLWEFYLSTVQ